MYRINNLLFRAQLETVDLQEMIEFVKEGVTYYMCSSSENAEKQYKQYRNLEILLEQIENECL